MSYYEFAPGDIISTQIITNPSYTVIYQGSAVTGSIYLEKPYLNSALANRQLQGFSERLGGFTTTTATITASVDIKTAQMNGQNAGLFGAIQSLYNQYAPLNGNYSLTASATTVRVISVPAIYYDRQILSATFSASDNDSVGALRQIYDDGRGGLYSGSLSGTLVGNIFYPLGLAILTAPNLNNFGNASPSAFQWRVDFQGVHKIPCNIYRCRAPASELNASTNPTFYTTPTSGPNQGYRIVLSSSVYPYVTAIGFYNQDFELVATARLAQPIKKDPAYDILFNCKMDW